MGPEIPIRVAGPADSALVADLVCGFRDYLGRETPTDGTVAGTVANLIADPNTEFLLAGEPAVGLAQIRYRPSIWTGSDDAWLEDVFILQEARGKGIGRMLTRAAIQRAERRGCGRIQTDTTASNQEALQILSFFGFSASHVTDVEDSLDILFTANLGDAHHA